MTRGRWTTSVTRSFSKQWISSGRSPQLMARMEGVRAGRSERNRLAEYRPYPKQAEFHAAGLAHRERLFLAGNQLGKTVAGAFEEAIHATGRYPAWWRGRR